MAPCRLASLSVSKGVLRPPFSPSCFRYQLLLPRGENHVVLFPVTNGTNVSVLVNGLAHEPFMVDLEDDTTSITIDVHVVPNGDKVAYFLLACPDDVPNLPPLSAVGPRPVARPRRLRRLPYKAPASEPDIPLLEQPATPGRSGWLRLFLGHNTLIAILRVWRPHVRLRPSSSLLSPYVLFSLVRTRGLIAGGRRSAKVAPAPSRATLATTVLPLQTDLASSRSGDKGDKVDQPSGR